MHKGASRKCVSLTGTEEGGGVVPASDYIWLQGRGRVSGLGLRAYGMSVCDSLVLHAPTCSKSTKSCLVVTSEKAHCCGKHRHEGPLDALDQGSVPHLNGAAVEVVRWLRTDLLLLRHLELLHQMGAVAFVIRLPSEECKESLPI